jgi:hypothetical protein
LSKRLNHLEEDIKVEAAIAKHASHDLCNYPYWKERLLEIQKTYDASRKVEFKHLWHDRRNISQWAMLWMVLLIGTLTLAVQVIQTVFSMLQAATVYRPDIYKLHTQL